MRLFFFVPPLFLDLDLDLESSSSSSTKPQTRFGVPSKGITQTKSDLADELLFLLFLELLLLLVELFLSCRWRSLLLLLDDFFFFLELDFFLLVVSMLSTTMPHVTPFVGSFRLVVGLRTQARSPNPVLSSLDDEEDDDEDELFFFFFLSLLFLLLLVPSLVSPGRSFRWPRSEDSAERLAEHRHNMHEN